MKILSLLLKNLTRRAATVRFPEQPPVGSDYRGLVQFDATRCTGCAMCKYRCTSRAITFRNSKTEYKWGYNPAQCTFCGRCVDGCQSGALSMQSDCPPIYLEAGALKCSYTIPRKPPAAKPTPAPPIVPGSAPLAGEAK